MQIEGIRSVHPDLSDIPVVLGLSAGSSGEEVCFEMGVSVCVAGPVARVGHVCSGAAACESLAQSGAAVQRRDRRGMGAAEAVEVVETAEYAVCSQLQVSAFRRLRSVQAALPAGV